VPEVKKLIEAAKNGKAFGIDELPNEVLKSPKFIDVLYDLLQMCLEYNILPSTWYESIVNPIPKSSRNDPRVPLIYRGISLLSMVYKLYSSILNNMLITFLED
jgi:hypothetical protein